MADQKALSIENLQAAMLENNTKMKAWVNDQLSKVSTFNIEWVESLPTEDISTNTIYMLKNESSTKEKNLYDEHVYNETTGWEILGQADIGSVDMANYYNKTEVDNLLKGITFSNYTDEEITTMVSGIWSE